MNSPPSSFDLQLTRVQGVISRHLSRHLVALYLYGSAVQGGLHPWSDMDLLAVVDQPLPAKTRLSLMRDVLAVSAWPGSDPRCRAVELTVLVHEQIVPWQFPPQRELQFGEWLRDDLIAGQVAEPETDFDLAILLTQLREHHRVLAGPPAQDLFDEVPPSDLAAALRMTASQWRQPSDWTGEERNILLALARVWFSLDTGKIVPKDQAASWALERLPPSLQPVMKQAKLAYLAGVPDTLAGHSQQVHACIVWIQQQLAL